ncbi:glycosyltransferase family 4 protein [Chelatococcus sambhunathii]|uniref:Glycosyltransferase family 4 protein n=1 Tax=Chelatococcus sambhunathii TaxID=363953 RepID=A0ABU1DBH3_9HYPH|nr:glycosyltransferase family 4 protein [Chelatococcus sambhunathii]MDR4305463.1 glycosyltransferase family 4 protein [Chelatococcus sambhunathii]
MARLALASPDGSASRADGRRYDSRLLAELSARRHEATWLSLPPEFPLASGRAIDAALARLASVPRETMLVVDELAYGTLPAEGVAALGRPVAALVRYPASMDPALSAQDADRLEATERAALAAADVVVATSAATRALLLDRFGVPKERLRVAEPGADPVPRARGGGGDVPVILTVGTVCPRKNQATLARALGRIADLGWRWRIVGSLDADPAYAEELRATLATEGLVDRTELVGEIDETALADAYDRADLFALTSRLEGYGMAYAEALARGLPVVAGAGEAAAGLISGAAGELVPPEDPATIAAALRGLLTDGDALARAARAARSAGIRLPRWFQCADVFEHLMEQAEAGR